ncbi:tail fiber domain-containing protein [Ferruginibacter sp.]
MKKIFFLIVLCAFFFMSFTFSQNVGIGTATPNASAQLDISSTTKGVLIPQISLDSLKDVTSVLNPANGLIIYNTTQPGAKNDVVRGYYYYSTVSGTWIRLADNFNDNNWQNGGLLGVQLRNKTNGVEMMDNFGGSSINYNPKLKILRAVDSATLNSKNNIPVLVLSGVTKKTIAGWGNRQKTSLIFENSYLLADGTTSGTSSVGISAYTENTTAIANSLTNGLGFYTFSPPHNTAALDTPTLSMYRRNVGIGTYVTDINSVADGRLQVSGFGNGDQLSLRHPANAIFKWGFYVSSIDSSLNFYYNGSLRSNIDRVTGVYTALSDRSKKKNIKPMMSVLEAVMKVPPYSFNYSDSKDTDRSMFGFMAQDIQPFFPELVYKRYDRDITKPVLTMDYSGLGVIAIKAIQEQQVIIQMQQQEIKEIKKEIDLLKEQNIMLIKLLNKKN